MGEIIRKEGKDMTVADFFKKFGGKIRVEQIAKFDEPKELVRRLYRKRSRSKKEERNREQLVLLHKSARIWQLKRYEMAEVMVTESDYYVLRHFKPDRVFDLEMELEKKGSREFIELLPEELFHGRNNEERRKEVKEYCEMVGNAVHRKNVKEVVLMYDDPDITEVLIMNNLLDVGEC